MPEVAEPPMLFKRSEIIKIVYREEFFNAAREINMISHADLFDWRK